MVTVARLLFAKNWKINNQINTEEWYRGMWKMAINDKLTFEMKLRRCLLKNSDIKNIELIFEICVLERGAYSGRKINMFLERK